MTDFLIYDLKVAVLLVVFYLFWQLLASHETFHRLNRMVLLSTIVLSLTLPLCVVTFHKTVEVNELPSKNSTSILSNEAGDPDLQQTTIGGIHEREGVDWRGLLEGPSGSVLFLLYLSGAVFCFARTLYSIYSVRRLISKCELHDAPQLTQLAGGKVVVAVAEKDVSPFSWMRTIIMNKTDFEESNAALLAHECGHIRNHHSVDVLFVDVLTALQWFNPVVWFLRQDLRTIHEYEADAAVVSQGFNRYQYLQLLIRKAAGCGGYSIANGINDSTLKKRITMMLKNKTPKHGWMRLLYIVPVVALSLAATAKTVVEYQYSKLTNIKKTGDVLFEDLLANQQMVDEKANENLKDEKTTTFNAISDSLKTKRPMFEIRKDADNGKRPLVFINGTEIPYDELVGISPDIIKSVNVVKQEEALKKYGPRAKDGVIFINIEDNPNQKGHEPFKVYGRVVDENHKPVVGAVVMIRGTKKGSVSDIDGNFTIDAPDEAIIDVSYVGMGTSSFKTNRAKMANEKSKEHVTIVTLKADGPAEDVVKFNATATWEPNHVNDSKAKFVYFIDGEEIIAEAVEAADVINFPEDVVSEQIKTMTVDKSDPNQVKIYITTKH